MLLTTPQGVCSNLAWWCWSYHAYLPCSAYFRHHICHLLSLEMFCRHLFSFYIIYGNYAVSCPFASHNICEMCNAILFNPASYIWMIPCPSFSSLHFHLSTMFVHSTTLPVNQPFEWVMEKSGVKTRPSEQTVLPVEADLLLGPDSSSEMDSETDDQTYSPTEVYALTWQGYTAHIMHTVSCIA